MGRQCLPIVEEEFSGVGPPPACCDINSRTIQPAAQRWPLAASAFCRQSWAAPNRFRKASPFPHLVPTTCCCCCCCCCCTSPFDLHASSSFTCAESWSLSVTVTFAASPAHWVENMSASIETKNGPPMIAPARIHHQFLPSVCIVVHPISLGRPGALM